MDKPEIMNSDSDASNSFQDYTKRMSEVSEMFQQRLPPTTFESPIADKPMVVHHADTPGTRSFLTALMHLHREPDSPECVGTIVWIDSNTWIC